MELPKIIKDEIWDYCRINNITNVDDFTIKLVKQGFTIEKYGATPVTPEPKIIEKIVEVEKIVEIEKLITNDAELKKITDELEEIKKLYQIELEKNKKLSDSKRDIYGEN